MKETTNKNPIKQRMILFLDKIDSNANQFADRFIALGILKNNTKNYLHSKSGIQSDMLTHISENYPQLNMNWLLTGKGPMLLPEQNLSENKSNLAKQTKGEERNSSIDELIKKKIEDAIMENIPAIISAVMDGMNKQMEGQNQVINKQLDMLQEVIRSLADLNSKSEQIHENVIKLSRKAQ